LLAAGRRLTAAQTRRCQIRIRTRRSAVVRTAAQAMLPSRIAAGQRAVVGSL